MQKVIDYQASSIQVGLSADGKEATLIPATSPSSDRPIIHLSRNELERLVRRATKALDKIPEQPRQLHDE